MTQRLTAQDLGLDPAIYTALLWVRDALDPAVPGVELPAWMRLDMRTWGIPELAADGGIAQTDCDIGSAMSAYWSGLIGATDTAARQEALARHRRAYSTGFAPRVLHDLFFEFPNEHRWSHEKAVEAIDRLLAGNTRDPWLTGRTLYAHMR